jgi:hypothetical protein
MFRLRSCHRLSLDSQLNFEILSLKLVEFFIKLKVSMPPGGARVQGTNYQDGSSSRLTMVEKEREVLKKSRFQSEGFGYAC